MSDLIGKMQEMSMLEQAHASSLSDSVEDLSNAVIRALLKSIAHDSQKHAGFFDAIVSVLKGGSQAIIGKEYGRLEAVLKQHIQVETKMMDEVKQLLDDEKDSRVRHLLVEIYDDEVKHHTLMGRLLDAVIRQEAIFEEDLWDIMWKDVPGHGTPIG